MNSTRRGKGIVTIGVLAAFALISGCSDTSGPNGIAVSPRGAANGDVAPTATGSGLVAAYGFDEGTGSTVVDGSGQNNQGRFGSGVTRTTAGRLGGALAFDGSGTVSIPGASSLSLTTAMTLEAWVKPWSTSRQVRDIVSKGNETYALLATSDNNALPAGGALLSNSSGPVDAFGTSRLPAYTWSHLAITYDGTALRFYVNGVPVSSRFRRGTLATSNYPLRIGGNYNGQFFRGLIDEVRIYNRPLSAAEIRTDMATPVAPPATGPGISVLSLSITRQPSSTARSGTPFAQQPVIQLRDALNNPLSQSGVVVTAAIATGADTLRGTTTATTDASGVATFSNLSIAGVAGDRTLSFSAPLFQTATSNAISVTAAPTQLAMATQPSSSVQSGVAFAQQPVIQLRDASNNPVSQSGVVVTAAIATGGGMLGGTTTATTDASGAASFTNLSITGIAGDRTLAFSASGLTSATSNAITVTVPQATPTQLGITTQPSASAQSGVAFAQQPVIQLRDASNNPVSRSGVVVTAAIATGGGTLGGTTAATTNASGAASFTNLSISGTAGNRTLTFSASGLTSATSNAITVTVPQATPTQLGITTQPSPSAQSGVAFAQQPVIQLLDASKNPVSRSGVVVTAAIATGGGTLGGTTTATTNAGGAASFANLSITGADGPRTLSFTAPSLSSATSNPISVTTVASTPGLYPNLPAAFSKSSQIDFSQTPASGGNDQVDTPIQGSPDWKMIYFGTNWSKISDPSAPQSAPSVWQGHWAPGSYGGGKIGQGGGHGIGNVFTYSPNGATRLYMSMRVYFDFDASLWHPISNKFVFVYGNNSLIMVQLKEGGNWRKAEELGNNGYPSFGVENSSDPAAIPGQVDNRPVPNRKWTQLEILIDLPNHVFKVWQDGVLTTNATPKFASTKITTVGIDAFRGGGGETLTTDLYYRYDHFYLGW